MRSLECSNCGPHRGCLAGVSHVISAAVYLYGKTFHLAPVCGFRSSRLVAFSQVTPADQSGTVDDTHVTRIECTPWLLLEIDIIVYKYVT